MFEKGKPDTVCVGDIQLATLLKGIGSFQYRAETLENGTQGESRGVALENWLKYSQSFIMDYVGRPELANWISPNDTQNTLESRIIDLSYCFTWQPRSQALSATHHHPSQYLLSFFAHFDGKVSENSFYLPYAKHSDFTDENYFPRKFSDFNNENECKALRDLWSSFIENVKALRTNAAQVLNVNTWQTLLRYFCSRLPGVQWHSNTTYFLNTVSLYEQSRIAAAIAACLAVRGFNQDQIENLISYLEHDHAESEAAKEPFCLLVHGNLSGIQNFLYDIPRRGAARSLKARSFKLQLLPDAAAEYFTTNISLAYCNILLCAGGNFDLLFPITFKEKLLECVDNLQGYLYESFGGEITLLVDSVELNAADFKKAGGLAEKWSEVRRKIADLKSKKYTALAKQNYEGVFGTMKIKPTRAEDMGSTLEPEDKEDTELGSALRRARFLIKFSAEGPEKGIDPIFTKLSFNYHLFDGDTGKLPHGTILEVIAFNCFSPREILATFPDLPEGCSLRYRIIAQHWPQSPINKYQAATFEDLVKSTDCINKLAVLRADVDDLGTLFGKAIRTYSLPTFVGLSTNLSDFFEGYLNNLAKEDYYRQSLGVVYAGGDDLFIVGAWDRVIDFVIRLRRDFDRLTCENQHLSFSGGVVVTDYKLPVRHAARLAEEAEDRAKNHQREDGRQKNAICIFDTVLGWDEFSHFEDFKNRLIEMLKPDHSQERGQVSQAFLRKLYNIWAVYQREKDLIATRKPGITFDRLRAEAKWQRWRWLLVYSLGRYATRYPAWERQIKNIQHELLDPRSNLEDRLGMVLRWTELLLRKPQTEER